MNGVLVIDKPAGPTSHDVVARARRAIGVRRIGHTGTLDPAATGVLPLVIGRATRLARFLSASDKSYDAVIRLGQSTDSGDAEGTLVGAPSRHGPPSLEAIDDAIATFRGTFMQQPPAFSAKKIDGRRSYDLARAHHGAPPRLPSPVEVTARSIDVLDVSGTEVTLRVSCSAGFYIRSLAHDLGDRLGTGAHVARLRRTRSGDFTLDHSVALDELERDPDRIAAAFVPMARMLPGLSSVVLTLEGARHALHGRALGPGDIESGLHVVTAATATRDQARRRAELPGPAGAGALSIPLWIRLLDQKGEMLGVARLTDTSGVLHPSVVLM